MNGVPWSFRSTTTPKIFGVHHDSKTTTPTYFCPFYPSCCQFVQMVDVTKAYVSPTAQKWITENKRPVPSPTKGSASPPTKPSSSPIPTEMESTSTSTPPQPSGSTDAPPQGGKKADPANGLNPRDDKNITRILMIMLGRLGRLEDGRMAVEHPVPNAPARHIPAVETAMLAGTGAGQKTPETVEAERIVRERDILRVSLSGDPPTSVTELTPPFQFSILYAHAQICVVSNAARDYAVSDTGSTGVDAFLDALDDHTLVLFAVLAAMFLQYAVVQSAGRDQVFTQQLLGTSGQTITSYVAMFAALHLTEGPSPKLSLTPVPTPHSAPIGPQIETRSNWAGYLNPPYTMTAERYLGVEGKLGATHDK